MSLITLTPFKNFDTIRDCLLNEFEEANSCYSSDNVQYLPVELIENDDKYIVRGIAPGIKAENINIEIEEGILSISYEHLPQNLNENETLHFSDFKYGEFQRTIKLGQNIEIENIYADYKEGIININIPKSQKALKKTIKINS
ncbi:Hsp20/alpha crystallin family protein [bacterium]|nr:Hsp20/alpha crystallin family protein [bacterium]